jgi:GPH family glycoside/pentoside/hexuronide:cation symporter
MTASQSIGIKEKSYIARTSGLTTKDYIGYALGDVSCCLVFGLVTSLLQKFYTDIFHLSPLFIMIMMVCARIWDAVNDPIMGRICDRMKPGRYGRYRPWFLYAAGPLTVSAILMFVKWPGFGEEGYESGTAIYAACTYTLFGMCYTMLQIPYGSLAGVVTTDERERTKLSVYRSIGAGLGSLPVILVASFSYKNRLDGQGNPILGANGQVIQDMQFWPVFIGVAAMSLISFVFLMLAFRYNKERVQIAPETVRKSSTYKIISLLFKNRAFVAISVASMLLLAGQMFMQSFYLYLFNDYFSKNWMNLVAMLCTYAPMAIFMLFTPRMVRRFGKKEICASGMIAAAIANLILFALRSVILDLWWLFLVLCFVSGCGLTFIILQVWSMTTDAIDDIEVKTGVREDGTAYAFFMFFRKLGQVIAALAVNGALLAMDYQTAKGAVQSLKTLTTMYDMATIIPAVLFGGMAVVLFVWYPLSKKKVAELQVAKEAKLKEDYESDKIKIAD